MKKVIMTAAAILLAAASLLAGKKTDAVSNGYYTYEVTEGSLKVFNKKGTAAIILDFKEADAVLFGKKCAVVENYGPIKDYLRSRSETDLADWPMVIQATTEYIEDLFVKNGKLQPVDPDEDDAQYDILIKVRQIDLGSYAAKQEFWNPFADNEAGGACMACEILVTDNQSGEVACRLEIDNCRAPYENTVLQRFCSSFGDLLFTKFIFRKAKTAR